MTDTVQSGLHLFFLILLSQSSQMFSLLLFESASFPPSYSLQPWSRCAQFFFRLFLLALTHTTLYMLAAIPFNASCLDYAIAYGILLASHFVEVKLNRRSRGSTRILLGNTPPLGFSFTLTQFQKPLMMFPWVKMQCVQPIWSLPGTMSPDIRFGCQATLCPFRCLTVIMQFHLDSLIIIKNCMFVSENVVPPKQFYIFVVPMKNKYKIKAQDRQEPTQASISPYLQQLRNLASEKCYRLDEIQIKIDRSKPVFEGLLSKIRKKQQRLRESLQVEKTRANKSARLAADYAELHELGVQIIEKHGLLKKFNDPNSNYSTRHNTKAQSPSVQRFVRGMRQEHEQPVPQFNVPEPMKPEIVHPPKQITPTLYELLQQKLNRKPQIPKPKPALSQQLSNISKQLKRQTDKLQQMRKSLKDSQSRNTVSQKRIRPAMKHQYMEDQPTMIKKTKSVKHFIDSKRNRLQQLRNQDSLQLQKAL